MFAPQRDVSGVFCSIQKNVKLEMRNEKLSNLEDEFSDDYNLYHFST